MAESSQEPIAVPGERLPEREALLREIEEEIRETAHLTGVRSLSEPVRRALLRVPRHRFVPEHLQAVAYENRALPLAFDQTVSQPYVVALMTELARAGPDRRVLEIGTGSGYQAAVLAELCGRLWSIETVPELAEAARRRLEELGYRGVAIRVGDGHHGWPELAPFDAIVVTAAALEIPPALERQLAPGGRLIIPVGPPGGVQDLRLVERDAETGLRRVRTVLPVAFVPLVGGDEPDTGRRHPT